MSKFLSKSRMLASMAMTMTRQFASRYNAKAEIKTVSTNMSATCRLAQASSSLASERSNGYGMRSFFIGNPNGTRDEMEQRRLKLDESFQRMKRLSSYRPQVNTNFGVPFKREEYSEPKKPLKQCGSVEEVLQYSRDPTKLAAELLGHMRQLEEEQKKNEDIVRKYRQLEAYAFRQRK